MPSARPSTRLLAALLGLGLALSTPVALAVEAPQGLLATHAGDRTLTWDEAIQDLKNSDVVFLGEQHGDPATHRLELAVLQALHETSGKRVVLSLEMFERDVQPVLDAYLKGQIPEAEFLSKSRPWPNYASGYRPLVEYAKTQGLSVIASNIPRRLASRVAKQGLEALNSLSDEERPWAPSLVVCPKDRLYARFRETMQGHPGVGEPEVERMYQAQCVKDATMAESISKAFGATGTAPLVLHVNGAFHSDEGLGVPAQLSRFAPALRQRVSTVLPAASPGAAPQKGLADLVFVVHRPEKE